jgi:hypothetical protein
MDKIEVGDFLVRLDDKIFWKLVSIDYKEEMVVIEWSYKGNMNEVNKSTYCKENIYFKCKNNSLYWIDKDYKVIKSELFKLLYTK